MSRLIGGRRERREDQHLIETDPYIRSMVAARQDRLQIRVQLRMSKVVDFSLVISPLHRGQVGSVDGIIVT